MKGAPSRWTFKVTAQDGDDERKRNPISRKRHGPTWHFRKCNHSEHKINEHNIFMKIYKTYIGTFENTTIVNIK